MEEELEEQEDDVWIKILVPLNLLSNINITKYFNYEPRLSGVFSRNNLSRIRDGAYVINLYLYINLYIKMYRYSLILLELNM